MSGDDKGKGIVANSGNYFPHYTGTVRISLAPVQEVKKLCPRCAAGERNYVHPYRHGGEERVCPGVSINPHAGKDGSGIQPKIRNLSERTAVQTDPVTRGTSVGKHVGGLVLYWATNRQAVSVHRVDTPSDPTRLAEPYIQRNRDRHVWGREDRQWSTTTSVYIQHEPFSDGVVPVMQNPPPPSLPHVIDKRVPKTGASTDGSQPVSPPRPAVVSSDKVDRRTAGTVHSAEQKIEAPRADSTTPKEEPKVPRPAVDPGKATIVQNGDSAISIPKQDDRRPADTATAPTNTVVRDTPVLNPKLEMLQRLAVGLPVTQLLLDRGELLRPSLVYSTAFITEAMDISNIEEDAMATALALMGLYRAMRLDSKDPLPLTEEEKRVARIFAPDARTTAALLDLLQTPVTQRRSRAEELMACWEKEARSTWNMKTSSDMQTALALLRKDAMAILRVAWDQPYVRAFMKGIDMLDREAAEARHEAQLSRSRRQGDNSENTPERQGTTLDADDLSAPEITKPAVKSESSAATLDPRVWTQDDMEDDD
jgi:hypothetical protein